MKRLGLLIFIVIALPACREKASSAFSGSHDTPARTLYHCAMHPQIVRDKPGDCPICGMRLVAFDQNQPAESQAGTIQLTQTREQLIGVKIVSVEKRDLVQDIRASAQVAYDPSLYSAILEHQQVVAARENLTPSANPEFIEEAKATVRASTLRLRQLGLSSEQIQHLGNSKSSPANLLLGEPGGTVWVYAELYDYEAGQVQPGQEVELASPAFSGQLFHGRVRGIDSILNTQTRTLRARIETPNPRGDLKPNMFLNATIHASLGSCLAVPETAVMDTGDRQLVYVALGQGHYEPRDVHVGRQAGGYDEVLAGLKEGDQVVAAANFFIDSESKIRAAAHETHP